MRGLWGRTEPATLLQKPQSLRFLKMRLDKFLAHARVGTRREVHAILKAGRVRVRGEIERDGARDVGDYEEVLFDGRKVSVPGPMVLAFHKPPGLITAARDRQATIYSVLPPWAARLKPVGRLDKDTEGLLLLTDDGELNHRLTSPRRHVEKEYVAELDREIDEDAIDRLRRPFTLENGERVRGALSAEKISSARIRLVIDEGKYHQVRRVFAVLGCRVTYLSRSRIGPMQLGELPRGACRPLSPQEVLGLRMVAGLVPYRNSSSGGQT